MSAVVTVPEFPDVPNLPGVPNVLRDPTAAIANLVNPLLSADTAGYFGLLLTPTWGIFDQSGNPVIVGDTVASLELRQDNDIPTYPVEGGGFASYNKIVLPKDIRITIAQGGSVDDRAVFLATVDAAVDSVTIYQAIMPEASYTSVNLKHYSFTRTSKSGVGLLSVEIWAQEVRVTATQTFSNTQSANGADPVSSGPVQASSPTSAQAQVATSSGAN